MVDDPKDAPLPDVEHGDDGDDNDDDGDGAAARRRERFARWSTHFEHSVVCDVAGEAVTLAQEPASDHVGHSVWDVSRAIAKLLEVGLLRAELRRHCRVLEVGAGCGLLGIAAAVLGARAVITDLGDILPILKANVAANAAVCRKTGGTAEVKELRWGVLEDAQALGVPFDVVLGTDVVYYAELVDPLVETLVQVTDERSQVIIVNERRSPRVHEMFLKAATKHFKYQRLDMSPVAELFDVSVFEAYIFRRRRK